MCAPAPLDEVRASQAALFEAMVEVPWVEGAGIPASTDPDGQYARLVATPPGEAVQRCMGGVEPVDDVIARDLGRTFPEHPLFVAGDGQARLGRLLRAYALHDEEVGYCQGQGEGVGAGRAGACLAAEGRGLFQSFAPCWSGFSAHRNPH
jgi:hypothetical protein